MIKKKSDYYAGDVIPKFAIILIIVILNTSLTLAFEFDNVKSYDTLSKTITFKNTVLGIPTSEIATAQLLTPQNNIVPIGRDVLVAEFSVNLTGDYSSAFKNMKFLNVRAGNRQITRNYAYKLKVVTQQQVPDIQSFCDDTGQVAVNGSKILNCYSKSVGTKTEEITTWEKLQPADLKKGYVIVGLFADTEYGDKVEWGMDMFGVSVLDVWATWTANYYNKLEMYHNFNTTTDMLGLHNLSTMGTALINDATSNPIVPNAAKLPGTSGNYLNTSGNSRMNYSSQNGFTVNIWANITAQTGNTYPCILDIEGTAGLSRLCVHPTGNVLWWTENAAGGCAGGDITTAYTPIDKKWHMYTIVLNATGRTVYVDGAYFQSVADSGCSFNVTNFKIGEDNTGSHYLQASLDELSVWNRALNASEVLYLNQTNLQYTPQVSDTPPVVTLVTPANATTYTSQPYNVIFNCSATDDNAVANVSLFINGVLNYTVQNSSATDKNVSLQQTLGLYNGVYNWSCRATDFTSQTDYKTNWLTISEPQLDITLSVLSPNGTVINPANIFSSIETAASGNISNVTVYVWNSSGIFKTNTSLTPTNSTNLSISGLTLGQSYNWSVLACAISNNGSSMCEVGNNLSIFYAGLNITSTVANTNILEMTLQNYTLNATKSYATNLTATLKINGTSYTPTSTCNSQNCTFLVSLETPLVGDMVTDKNYTWIVQANESTTSSYLSMQNYSQTVNRTILTLCNSTYPVRYLNFSFQDEVTSFSMNGTIVSATFNYWLSGSTQARQYIYTNLDLNNPNYSFCFSPPYLTTNYNLSMFYAYTGYPQRTYSASSTINNQTNSTILQLLSSSSGVYATLIGVTVANSPISGIAVSVEREITGVWTFVGSATSDSAGATTFFLNPNYLHRVTASKTTYATNQFQITPSSNQYTYQMQQTTSNVTYSTNIIGLIWYSKPLSGYLTSSVVDFNFTINSSLNNIVACKLELLNADNTNLTVINSTTGCTSSGGYLSIIQNVAGYKRIKGRYSVDVGNGYFVLDADNVWILENWNATGTTLFDFLNDLTNINISNYGNDVTHQEYTNIVGFFFFLMLILASLSFFTGWDMANPGGIIVLVAILTWIGSFAGLLNLNMITGFAWLNKYFIALIFTFFAVGYAGRRLSV